MYTGEDQRPSRVRKSLMNSPTVSRSSCAPRPARQLAAGNRGVAGISRAGSGSCAARDSTTAGEAAFGSGRGGGGGSGPAAPKTSARLPVWPAGSSRSQQGR